MKRWYKISEVVNRCACGLANGAKYGINYYTYAGYDYFASPVIGGKKYHQSEFGGTLNYTLY